ncbi:MAG: SDR family oxidoreductase [Oleispira sp.]|nr:SDR family oxidoreductase [Oleispira sp.]MBL4881614.1 SDR family oxidoreductase [Oleispira sp.]
MTKLGARSSTDDVLQGKDLTGRTVVITGSNCGIGFETAQALAGAGAKVIFACRNVEKGEEALRRCKALHPQSDLAFFPLDLASADSIKHFCTEVKDETIDTLICNAGLVPTNYQETKEGLEMTVGVCHFGHFLLTQLLLPQLLETKVLNTDSSKRVSPRVVMVSSESHRMPAKLNFNKFPLKKTDTFIPLMAYGQAKLCNALFANELQRRFGDQGLTACSLHPGALITTSFGRDSGFLSLVFKLVSPLTKNPNQGAATTVYCASHENTEELAGKYFSHCKPVRSTKEANNPETARKLWEVSEEWVTDEI